MPDSPDASPLISVVIPAFNYAVYLPRAIESVLNQTYRNFEVIIIDDGSTDNSAEVIKPYKSTKYFYQENAGLAAARNAGIEKSKGDYLVFLDADDWLESDGLEQNYMAIKDNPLVAFASGNYFLLPAATGKPGQVAVSVPDHHYMHLLRSNYIGMHAAVIFQRWVLKKFKYDETLKACEDYDLYLRIARKYPVIHHQKFIATYYFHAKGLSHNYPLMMNSINTVLKKQARYIRSAAEKQAYAEGLQQWHEYRRLLQKIE